MKRNIRIRSHDYERMFELLDATEDRDDHRLMQLEWQFLRALEHSKRGPRALLGVLQNDPTFFALVISWVYRSDKERDGDKESPPGEARRKQAEQAHHLLACWKGIPGSDGEEIDKEKLNSWIDGARSQLAASGHREVGDRRIGEVLIRSPESADGVWPSIAVRDVIERIRSRDVERGICLGLVNSRGFVLRGTGGTQERELAERYRTMAENCATSWPRTSSVLARIADHYASEAKHWDDDAERDDLR